jgi:STE24 endopeptidase
MKNMNPYLAFVLAMLVGNLVLEWVIARLNLSCLDSRLPDEFIGLYDQEKYARSQDYTRERTRFGLFHSSITTVVTLLFILAGGFNLVDRLARSLVSGPILTGLVFTLALSVLSGLLSLPFSGYSTFVIEARYGFNRTTVKTFVLDLLKGLLLAVLIGAPVLALALWLFGAAGRSAWIVVWIAVTGFQLFMTYLAPVIIMPLFNRFTALEEGDLKNKVEAYAREQGFKLKGIFKMDGSRRSSKANAFFTGLGRHRRIVLFDTLIEKHPSDELLAILAHEVGHFKLGHIRKMMFASIMHTGLLLFLLSFFIRNPGLSAAFRMEHLSIYASLVFFGFLYSPISTVLSIVMNWLSRRHEFEADQYSVRTTGTPEAFIVALKRLSVDSLTNLTPHPLKVFFEYSHPPVLQRIVALRGLKDSTIGPKGP